MLSDEGGVTDYLVVGSGVAGLFTAICLADRGRVIVLSKQELISGNTWFAQGGIAAAYSKEDSPNLHLNDTYEAGACFGDLSAIKVMVEEAPARINDLLAMGVQFDRRNGSIDLGQEGAHSRKRILHIGGDATGRELIEALLLCARSKGVIFIENAFVEHLLIDEGRCTGVCFLSGKSRSNLFARAVVLATGGCGQIYEYTTNAPSVTGDGLAMAYWAGAVLRDMEFFQFHPTVFMPSDDSPFLISEAVRGEGAYLVNCFGERFMPDQHPKAELGPRDVVARAIMAEKRRTGCDVCLDLRHFGDKFARERFPTIYNRCQEWGLKISRDLIPVSPAAHYLIGGVQVDVDGRTGVKNLYAVGEIASTGVHGANRLASNSLLEGLVFGHRVALAAVNEGQGDLHLKGETPHLLSPASAADEMLCGSARSLLQKIMWSFTSLLREENGLMEAKEKLKEMQHLMNLSFTRPELSETRNMLLLAGMMVEAALERRESKGCHYRLDYPQGSPALSSVHIAFQKEQNLFYQQCP